MGESQTVSDLCSGGAIGAVRSLDQGVPAICDHTTRCGGCRGCPIRQSQLAGAGASEHGTLQAGEVAI